jgi:hypothetical protein
MNILESALGHYETRGRIEDADVIVGHSFGTLTGEGSVNRYLAERILDNRDGRPIVVDRNLANAFGSDADQIDYVVEGQASTAAGKGVGTWGTLVEAKDFMDEHGLERPLMIAQACHIGRVAMQAQKLHMDAVIPADLPASFDAASEQIWTRSKILWIPREVVGSLVLRYWGQL